MTTTSSESSSTVTAARKYYRVKDAAAVLGVPVRTLYHLAETEQIPCRRLGTVVLIPASWWSESPRRPVGADVRHTAHAALRHGDVAGEGLL